MSPIAIENSGILHPLLREGSDAAQWLNQRLHEYHEQGYTVLKNLLNPEIIEHLKQEVLAVLQARNLPDSYLAQSSEYLQGSYLDRLNNGSELRTLIEDFLGGVSSLYLPFTAVKGAHQGGFNFHQDNNYTLHEGPSCNCWIALGPCTKENGCLQLVPHSHEHGTVASKAMFIDEHGNESHRTVAEAPETGDDIELEPGDAVLFSRLTVHGSGPNVTDSARIAYAVQFHRNDTKWYNPETKTWALLKDSQRWDVGPVSSFSDIAGVGE